MNIEDLGRRAVACKHFRWMPGMTILGSKGRRVVVIGLSGATEATSGMDSRAIGPDELPDLSSPATLGCLLHLVREAWRAPHAAPQWDQRWQHWAVLTPKYNEECESWTNLGADNTEAEALVAALEAAP